MINLKKLDLGYNRIKFIEGLETLSNLLFLALNSNRIQKLSGIFLKIRYACT